MKAIRNTLAAVSMAALALSTTVASASGAKKGGEQNCEVKGKKKHAKDQAACEKMHGKWLEAAAAAPAATETAPAAAEAPAAEEAPTK